MSADKGGRQRTFSIRTEWNLNGRPEELTAIVLDPEQLSHWCRTVFMGCDVVERGDGRGLGMATRVYSKGLLPHSFVFDARVTRIVPHRFLHIDVSGDFEGFGELEVFASGDDMRVAIHWYADCRHPFIGPLSRLLPAVFEFNHRWALARGSVLMQREIDRRRAGLALARPPVPTFPHNVPLLRSLLYRSKVAARAAPTLSDNAAPRGAQGPGHEQVGARSEARAEIWQP